MESWTFLTNYGHVLLCIAADPEIRLKDVAERVGITERSTQRIVADLIAEGYLMQSKVGRRNRYRIRLDLPLRHPVERKNQIGVLLKLLDGKAPGVAKVDAESLD
jgi:MarR-like DNA-binding transcriptional regulator SgrR of sgrS sRNA